MLVYLDSAHFDYLERATAAELAHFHSVWTRVGCELALSLHHLQEMAQLADEVSLTRRLRVIESFPVVRCLPATSELVLRFEAQVQVIRSLGFSVDLAKSAIDTLFPIASFADIELAMAANAPILRSMREPLKMGTEASNLTKGQQRRSFRRPIALDEATRLQARELALEAVQDQPPAIGEMLLALFDQVESEVVRTGNVRAALESLYGLDEVAVRPGVPDTDLASIAVLFQTARGEAGGLAARLGIDLDRIREAVEDLDPYACPGFALQLAARRARETHTRPDEPSDELDLAHLAFAPYVTLLFVDKRTHSFIHQEMRRSDGRLDPSFARNIVRVGSLSQLERHISLCAGAV